MAIPPRNETPPENEISWVDPYSPVTTELDGLTRLNAGVRIVWLEMTQGNLAYWRREEERVIDDGFCCCLGTVLVATGLWQLRLPIVIGIAGGALTSYSNLFR